jgi:hypothetical protein
MSARANAHRLLDCLPEENMEAVERFLADLATLDPLERTLLLAPPDDESDNDDADGGLTQSLRSMERGEGINTDELKRELGIE